jgi:hypothetical protein
MAAWLGLRAALRQTHEVLEPAPSQPRVMHHLARADDLVLHPAKPDAQRRWRDALHCLDQVGIERELDSVPDAPWPERRAWYPRPRSTRGRGRKAVPPAPGSQRSRASGRAPARPGKSPCALPHRGRGGGNAHLQIPSIRNLDHLAALGFQGAEKGGLMGKAAALHQFQRGVRGALLDRLAVQQTAAKSLACRQPRKLFRSPAENKRRSLYIRIINPHFSLCYCVCRAIYVTLYHNSLAKNMSFFI